MPPELAAGTVTVHRRVGGDHIDISTHTGNQTGLGIDIVVARHRLAADGAGVDVRDHGHVIALDQAAMAAVNSAGSARPHRRKERIPPGDAARAAAQLLLPVDPTFTATVTDLAAYEAAAQNRTTLP